MTMRPRGRKRRQQEAERVFTPDPISRPAGPPASSAPLRDYFATTKPGADPGYVVLPRSLVEAMPLPWQQHMTYLLSEFHQAFSHVTWPIYRVQPSRHEKLTDLDEEQLAEVGYVVEIDQAGELVYRDRAGRVVVRPGETTVLVSCLDPIPPPRPPIQGRPTGPRPGPADEPPGGQPGPVDAEPEDTPPHGVPLQQFQQTQQPPPPGGTFGPTGHRSQPNHRW
jgi:hypothetical protein